MKHLKHMALGAAVIFAALLLFGVSPTTALQYALFLSCPVMMIGMMFFMNHGSGRQSDGRHDHSHTHAGATSAEPESRRHQ